MGMGMGVIETLTHSRCFWVGVDIPQGIQHSSVVFWCDGSGVIPCFPKVPSFDGGGAEAQRMRSRSKVADCLPGCK